MHPEYSVLLLRTEREQEAAEARRHTPPRGTRRVPSWRKALGHRLVGLGQRLALEEQAA
jgi:hypothetical protein